MILLDTQAALWLDSGDVKLGPRARQEIDRAWQSEGVAISAITFWETAMLRDKGRIRFPDDVLQWRLILLAQGYVEIPVDGEIAADAGLIPDMHGDPADRIIVATALEGHQLITSDRKILSWPGHLTRLDASQ